MPQYFTPWRTWRTVEYMTETIHTPLGAVNITFDPDDGYITDADNWAGLHAANAANWAIICCRTCYDGKSTYSLEHYFTAATR